MKQKVSQRKTGKMKKAITKNSQYKFFRKLQGHTLTFGRMALIFLLIIQLFNQPVAVVAMSVKAKHERERLAREAKKANKKVDKKRTTSILSEPTKQAEKSEGLIPDIEKFARKSFSDNFGAEFPLPQMFGQNGQLSKLLPNQKSIAKRNKELTKEALSKNRKAELKHLSKSSDSNEARLTDTAISVNAPVLNQGSIDGSLRVLSSSSFGVNEGFQLSENLYAYGLPNITTRDGAKLNQVINEKGDITENKYQLSLNGGEIDGRIHIRSNLPTGLTDYPKSILGTTGTQDIEINSSSDAESIKDWQNVRSIDINTSDEVVVIPPGNYKSLTFKTPSKIVFSRGTYNFSETINFQKGSSIPN